MSEFFPELATLLEPHDHEMKMSLMGLYVRLGEATMLISHPLLMAIHSSTYDIHHTEECLEGQKNFYDFQGFIEEFGGYVPTPTCDCPRDKIPPDPEQKAKMFFNQLWYKYHSSNRRANKNE